MQQGLWAWLKLDFSIWWEGEQMFFNRGETFRLDTANRDRKCR
jgi:hypothetical protein